MQGDPRSVLAKIHPLSGSQSIWACWGMVNAEIARQFFVDTGRVPGDERMEAIYKGVQTCLRTIGFYDGEADGNWRRTNAAVVRFQGKRVLRRTERSDEIPGMPSLPI